MLAPSKFTDEAHTFKPKGEAWVWLCSMGLTLGVLMVVFLLALIFWNGITVFWPKDVYEIELNAGDGNNASAPTIIAGSIVKRQNKKVRVIKDEENAENNEEWQLFVGNKDSFGFMFQYIDAKDVQKQTQPENIYVAERLEYGNAIFYADEIVLNDGKKINATDPTFDESLQTLVDASVARWDEIRKIEKHQIGKINHKIRKLETKQRTLKKNEPNSQKIQEIQERLDHLQVEYQTLASKTRDLRKLQKLDHLNYKLANGTKRSLHIGQIVKIYKPNKLGFFGKTKHFITHFFAFLTEEPREANTEGGILPAIVGTFTMTLLMSIAVTPFGVLSAVYLREYAKPSLFVQYVRIAINNLAGVPAIVFGVFGLGFFVYGVGGFIDSTFFSSQSAAVFGTGGILWASLTLALMTIPVIIVATEEALAAVPRGAREASLACGASKWQTIQRIVLPASAPGILTGLILAMARGAGEVAPLMLVGVVKLAPDLPVDLTAPFIHLERKFMHLGFHIYDLGFQSPDSEAALPMVFATTFLLITLVIVLNLTAILIRNHLHSKYATSTF